MNIALILAGGKGLRMGAALPKQFLPLSGKPILLHSIETFEAHREIDKILVVTPEEELSKTESILKKQAFHKIIGVISGGKTRQESSYCGLCYLEQLFSPEDIVLIHDAARPLVDEETITRTIAAVLKYSAVTTAIPVQDTILISEDHDKIQEIPDRQSLYAVQTPQAFRLGLILKGHRQAPKEQPVTDDSGLLLSLNIPVYFVEGNKRNLKITSFEDLIIAEVLLGKQAFMVKATTEENSAK